MKRVFGKGGIRTYFEPTNTLRQSFFSPKDPLENNEKTEAVYHISCKECPATYIGETGRALGTRFAEHWQPSRITSAQLCVIRWIPDIFLIWKMLKFQALSLDIFKEELEKLSRLQCTDPTSTETQEELTSQEFITTY